MLECSRSPELVYKVLESERASEKGGIEGVGSSIEGLQLTEFFLVLSSTGLAYRRCQLAWVNGDQIGVIFLVRGKTPAARRGARDRFVS